MSLLGKKHKNGSDGDRPQLSNEPASASAPAFLESRDRDEYADASTDASSSQEVREQETSADLVNPPVPDEDLPVQTDRPSYAELWAGGQADRLVRVRQIRHRPSNLPMVAGIFVSRDWKTVSLASVADCGRSHMRELADDQTIEVHFTED
jgi:hypothetical protein